MRFVQCVERVKKFFLNAFFAREKLDVINQQHIGLPIFFAKADKLVVLQRINVFVREFFRRNISNARGFFARGNVLADGVDVAQQAATIQAIRSLLQTKAPIQGIALGSHFGEQLLAPDRIWAVLDRFAELRLPLSVTDFEVDTWDEQAQADYTRDFAMAVFAHPGTSSLSLAAFWAKIHPIPNAALYAADWTPRPSARAWQELMDKKWSSSATITTNGKGVAKTKAFMGYYAIEIRGGAKPKVVYTKLGKSGRWLDISMPSASSP
jgi:hypothetical protein